MIRLMSSRLPIVPRAVVPLLLSPVLLWAQALDGLDEPWKGVPLAAHHLGTYGSPLAARVTADGRIDTGAVVVRLVDLDTGAPITAERADFDAGPDLVLTWRHPGPGWRLRCQAVGGVVKASGDERFAGGLKLTLANQGGADAVGRLAVEFSAGGEGLRPLPSRPWQAGETWALEGRVLLRGDAAVALLPSGGASAELAATPASADDVAARLPIEIAVPAGETRELSLLFAGPPAAPTRAEEAWRKHFASRNYDLIAEEARWQSDYAGSFGKLSSPEARLRHAMVASVATLRMLGAADRRVRSFSDRPYGQPASDAAVEPQALGVLFEYGLADIGTEFLAELLAEADARMADLSPARRLMFLHGLARCVRLAPGDGRASRLATLVEEFLAALPDGGAGLAALPVDPWLHPENVRLDLLAVFAAAGKPAPELATPAFAAVEAGSTEALMAELARAILARDGDATMPLVQSLLDQTTERGFGSMTPGREPDGRWAQGLATLLRELCIDDHGPDLHLFSGASYGLLELTEDIELHWMPTRFGVVKPQQFHTGPKLMGGWVHMRNPRWPERMLMHFPPGVELRRVKGVPDRGTVTILGERLVQFDIAPDATRGIRFLVTTRGGPYGGAAAGDDEDDSGGSGDG